MPRRRPPTKPLLPEQEWVIEQLRALRERVAGKPSDPDVGAWSGVFLALTALARRGVEHAHIALVEAQDWVDGFEDPNGLDRLAPSMPGTEVGP